MIDNREKNFVSAVIYVHDAEQNIADFEIKKEKYGKPCVYNHKNIYFNLSHSGKMVLCAISDREIGADIEYNDPEIDLNIAKNFFFNREYESIMNSEKPHDAFSNIGF